VTDNEYRTHDEHDNHLLLFYLTLKPEASFEAYDPMLNIMLVFLFASVIVLAAMFAYAK